MSKPNPNKQVLAGFSDEARLQNLLSLHGQTFRLLKEIERLPREAGKASNPSFAQQYNRLSDKAAKLAGSVEVAALVPQHAWYISELAVMASLMVTFAIALLVTLAFWDLEIFGIREPNAIVMLVCWLGLVTMLLVTIRLFRGKKAIFSATVQEVSDRAVLLLAYIRENITEIDPTAAAELPLIVLSQESDSEEQPRPPQEAAKTMDMQADSAVPNATRPSKLSESERRHLGIQFQEQQKRYDQLTARIDAVTNDLGREMDGEKELLLKERRDKLIDEREQVQTLLKTIERALNENQEP